MKVLKFVAAAAAVLSAFGASAESTINTAAASGSPASSSTSARLDFQITVPRILFLRVGTGAAGNFGTSGTVDLINYTLTNDQTLTGGAIAATSGGDVSPGVVTARLFGNGGQITLNSSTAGAMTNTATPVDTIAFTTIGVAATTGAGTLPHPGTTLFNGAGTAPQVFAGKVTNLTGQWTYTFNAATGLAAGTYGGGGATNVGNGRVTYTATML
jgi:hypothetical protein